MLKMTLICLKIKITSISISKSIVKQIDFKLKVHRKKWFKKISILRECSPKLMPNSIISMSSRCRRWLGSRLMWSRDPTKEEHLLNTLRMTRMKASKSSYLFQEIELLYSKLIMFKQWRSQMQKWFHHQVRVSNLNWTLKYHLIPWSNPRTTSNHIGLWNSLSKIDPDNWSFPFISKKMWFNLIKSLKISSIKTCASSNKMMMWKRMKKSCVLASNNAILTCVIWSYSSEVISILEPIQM